MLVAQLLPARPHGTAAAHRKAPGTAPPASHAAAADDDDAPLELALLRREQSFDGLVKQRAEDEREANVLRDMAMAQLKKDDENMKKWIALI